MEIRDPAERRDTGVKMSLIFSRTPVRTERYQIPEVPVPGSTPRYRYVPGSTNDELLNKVTITTTECQAPGGCSRSSGKVIS